MGGVNGADLITGERLLTRFGVSEAAESVWRVLIAEPDVSLDELGQRTCLASTDRDRAIDELLDASLARSGNSPTGVATIDPKLALEARLAAAERQMAEQAEAFTALRMLIPQLSSDYQSGRSSATSLPGFEVVVPRADIQRQADLAAERTISDIRSLDHLPTPFEDTDSDWDLLARGVRDRAILATASLELPGIFENYLKLQEAGHDARSHPDVATRMFIFDRDLAVLPVDNSRIELGAVFIRLPSLIEALIMMYEAMWEVATPIFSAAVNGAPVGRHARILELLALGNKDAAMSRTLNIGMRTIRRDVADIKDSLGVSSRAEIVAAAVRKGWLSHPIQPRAARSF